MFLSLLLGGRWRPEDLISREFIPWNALFQIELRCIKLGAFYDQVNDPAGLSRYYKARDTLRKVRCFMERYRLNLISEAKVRGFSEDFQGNYPSLWKHSAWDKTIREFGNQEELEQCVCSILEFLNEQPNQLHQT